MLYMIFLVWLRTGSNPEDINQLQSHVGNYNQNIFVFLNIYVCPGDLISKNGHKIYKMCHKKTKCPRSSEKVTFFPRKIICPLYFPTFKYRVKNKGGRRVWHFFKPSQKRNSTKKKKKKSFSTKIWHDFGGFRREWRFRRRFFTVHIKATAMPNFSAVTLF